MSAYDKAYELASQLASSEEYRLFQDARRELENDEADYIMLRDFRTLQWQVQLASLGGNPDEEKSRQVEQLYQLISLNPKINAYLLAEYRLTRLLADIQKIISEALPDWMELEEKDRLLN